MSFAHWKNISGTGVEVGKAATPGRGQFQADHHMAERFVVDIPEGTTQAEVVEKLHANSLPVGNPDGMGFEDEWPDDVRQQRQGSPKLVTWLNLK